MKRGHETNKHTSRLLDQLGQRAELVKNIDSPGEKYSKYWENPKVITSKGPFLLIPLKKKFYRGFVNTPKNCMGG